MGKRIQSLTQKSERLIIHTLIVMMAFILILATIELGYNIVLAVMKPPNFLLEFEEILDLFGIFLLVLIGIELLDTIKVYFKKNIVHVEVVVLVAIIAISRKVIVLEPNDYEPGTLIGIGIIILALAVSYFLIKRLGCEIVSIKDLPKTSQEVIKEEIGETKKILAGDDAGIDLSDEAGDRGDTPGGHAENREIGSREGGTADKK